MSVVSSHYATSSAAVLPSCDYPSTAADVDQPINYHQQQNAAASTRQHRVSSTASTEEAVDEEGFRATLSDVDSDPSTRSTKVDSAYQQQQSLPVFNQAVPLLPPHRSPSLMPEMTQSTPCNTRRLTQRELTSATPASQPSSPRFAMPRQQSDTTYAAAVAPSTHTSASYHPDIPLAAVPSFSLHHRHHHLNKFLSSPLGSALLLSKLRSGAIFLKHGQRGAPHYRYVWVKEEEGGRDRVCWAELRRRDKVRGWMDVRGLGRVEEGHGTGGVFARSRGSDPRRCLTVVGEDRTLDLECISEEDREMWVIAFAFLIEHTRRGGSLSGGVGVDVAGISPSLSLVSALELLCEQNHSLSQSKPSSAYSTSSHYDEERKELLSSTASTAGSSCYSTPERQHRSGETDLEARYTNYTSSASFHQPLHQQHQRNHASPPYPHVSPTSQVRVSHVNRFEVIDIIDDGLPIPPPHHVAAALPLSTASLPTPAASDDPRLLRLHADLELYKADNKRLLLSHAHKMMTLQREMDELMQVNAKLRQMKVKADRGNRHSGVRSGADSDGELYQQSDSSDD